MKKLYVLVSNTLSPVYGCVQGGHAVAQWLIDNKEIQTWNNNYLIYVYADIEKWINILEIEEINYSVFYEPDLYYKPTAIAVESDGRIFKKLKKVE